MFVAAACVHEYPKQEIGPTRVETRITLTTTTPFTHSSIPDTRNEGDMGCIYFVVELHRDEFGSSPAIRRETGIEKSDNGSATIELTEALAPGKYKCVAYAAAASDTEGNGMIFNLDDLADIHFEEGYVGNTDAKECYEVRFDLDVKADGSTTDIAVEKVMTTPMASVEAISTDADLFLRNETGRIEISAASETSGEIWDDYYAVWKFDLFHPVRYNAYTGLPNKAETMVSFRSDITPLSATEASLGMDYIFVNGDRSQITLTLEIYDRQDNLINTHAGINADIERGKTTVISGEYLTDRNEPGVGIDPDFDGDINIEIPQSI